MKHQGAEEMKWTYYLLTYFDILYCDHHDKHQLGFIEYVSFGLLSSYMESSIVHPS